MNDFKNVYFAPFVGRNYEVGVEGKKILILGESHYWGEEIYERVEEDLKKGKYLNDTTNVVRNYITYKSEGGEFLSHFSTFTKFTNGFYNWERNDIDYADFWNSVAFYNFVQFPMTGIRTSPTSEQFEKSEKAFYEVLEKYQPDAIIAWSWRLWRNMPSTGYYGKPSQVNKGKGIYYYKVNNKEYPIIAVAHPCTRYFNETSYQCIRELLASV